jgi:AcrR family transcriptional regulator
MTRPRLLATDRKAQILEAALQYAAANSFAQITFAAVGRLSGCGRTTAIYHFHSIVRLRSAVMRIAVKRGVLKVVAQGLVARHSAALAAPDDLKARALASLRS